MRFPHCVKWMSLEFDGSCATAQPEDSLQLYIPAFDLPSRFLPKGDSLNDLDVASSPYWPVLHKFSGRYHLNPLSPHENLTGCLACSGPPMR